MDFTSSSIHQPRRLRRPLPLPSRAPRFGNLFRKQMLLVGLLIWPLALLTMYSRVYLGYHTVAQVFAGAGLGVFLGGLWFWVVNSVLRGLFPVIEESFFGRLIKKIEFGDMERKVACCLLLKRFAVGL
ncbi:hypothetical protein LXL04_004953 [Taraxacum kok-saghyz]